ncbi:hypothetical protein QUG98_12245 [Curtobacterium sp. RHCJP20]|uniref:Uncharacterized protein n=1 Tax=Curtobacterium subtropicum TaxID=3055138 RepID=A0ABT7TIM3_9MICO|nr:hypothetical protein [Curtobacterium subtropicum]MDM7889219.1 hypothetical protein [Curtobacterium subtropicum]
MLDDTVAVDDPRVTQVAAERHAVETALMRVFDARDAQHPAEDVDVAAAAGDEATKAAAVIRRLPHDLSPARLRAMELAVQLGLAADGA